MPDPHISSDIEAETDGLVGQGAHVRRSVLPGGIRVLTETMPGARSATFGAWVPVGSRDETADCHGSTHFLEHLLFKGTRRRSALQIAQAFDQVGGEANAATGKEHTCYYARVRDEDLPMAVDVIGDMVTSATLTPEDFANERGVILEELAMNDDDGADVAHERFAELVMGDSPLGRPIGGRPEDIEAVTRERILEHYHEHYVPNALLVTAAGGLTHEHVCELVAAATEHGGWTGTGQETPRPRRPGPGGAADPGEGRELWVDRPTEQTHIIIGGRSLPATDPRRYTLALLSTLLGGGMSSRLFQEVRERRGLAYSVYSFASGYSDAGYFGVYAGCLPAKTTQVVDVLTGELERIATELVPADELARVVGQVAGSMVLGLEDTGSRMSRLGRAELVYGELTNVDEVIARYRAVTREQIRDLAAELISQPRFQVVVGPEPT